MDRLELPLGTPLPPLNVHAISVSVPTWKDFVGYQEGDPSCVKPLLTGYPRFVIHKLITQLAEYFLHKEGHADEKCLLFHTEIYANECKIFILAQTMNISPPVCVRQHRFSVSARNAAEVALSMDLHAVFFPDSLYPIAKQFWQHSGFGISSRIALRCLYLLEIPEVLPSSRYGTPSQWRRYIDTKFSPSTTTRNLLFTLKNRVESREDPVAYSSAMQAKTALKHRIAGFLAYDGSPAQNMVCEDDIFLYPTGTAAIWHLHKLIVSTRPTTKFVCFGFLYLDTVKILQKWGPGCHLLGRDIEANLNKLEDLLSSSQDFPPISALFCEIPSNPLLQSPPLNRLRILADKYDFLLVVDDTVGSFVNVNVLPYADCIVTSLSKYICGYANALGGSLVFNPRMRHYKTLKASHILSYDANAYFEDDVIVMETNSRDFVTRMRITNSNTNALCEFLRSRSLLAPPGDRKPVIKEIFYPKWVSRDLYDICRLKKYPDGRAAEDNFGGLFSLTFISPLAAQVFFDTLACAKGPSLGTNFTLACPYTILAHYKELDWAAEHGVEKNLVRVSVGLEEQGKLLEEFEFALGRAEEAMSNGRD